MVHESALLEEQETATLQSTLETREAIRNRFIERARNDNQARIPLKKAIDKEHG